jgi:hypothetical protein
MGRLRAALALEACVVLGWAAFIWGRAGMSLDMLERLACSVSCLSITVPGFVLALRDGSSVLRSSAGLRVLFVGLHLLMIAAGLWLLFELVKWV